MLPSLATDRTLEVLAGLLEPEEVWTEAGRLIGVGVPWPAVWDTPTERLSALLDGMAEARGAGAPESPPNVSSDLPGAETGTWGQDPATVWIEPA